MNDRDDDDDDDDDADPMVIEIDDGCARWNDGRTTLYEHPYSFLELEESQSDSSHSRKVLLGV